MLYSNNLYTKCCGKDWKRTMDKEVPLIPQPFLNGIFFYTKRMYFPFILIGKEGKKLKTESKDFALH